LKLSDPGISNNDTALATDDWPFIYTMEKGIPSIYWYVIGMFFVISIVFITSVAPGAIRRTDLHFLFLGAAFMLIEVRSITQLALFFGSTWLINSIVITAILLMILAANTIVVRAKNIPLIIPYTCLWFMLLFIYLFPTGGFLNIGLVPRMILSSLMLTSPLFFAGIIFAISFKGAKDMSAAFASNLVGAIIGGLFEYASSLTGLRFLCLFSLGFYMLSFVFLFFGKNRISFVKSIR
jgi:hypothetical protein